MTRLVAAPLAGRRPGVARPDLPSRAILPAASMGALVPGDLAGCVHSVFAGACNVMCDAGFVTIVGAAGGAGPTTIVLSEATTDLRLHFGVGEAVGVRGHELRGPRASVPLRRARVWRAPPRRAPLAPATIAARLDRVAWRLQRRRRERPNQLDREGAALLAALAQATRTLADAAALHHARALIGLGEGLTPAGDDFLCGWIAGLQTLAIDPRHREFVATLATGIAAETRRTTPLSAHVLALAMRASHGELLCGLRDALLCEPGDAGVNAALEEMLAVGATSGADAASGLLAAAHAWWTVQ